MKYIQPFTEKKKSITLSIFLNLDPTPYKFRNGFRALGVKESDQNAITVTILV